MRTPKRRVMDTVKGIRKLTEGFVGTHTRIQEISPFQFVEINGMKVTEPSYAYVLLWLALSDQKVTANHALQLLEKQFSTPGPRRLPW